MLLKNAESARKTGRRFSPSVDKRKEYLRDCTTLTQDLTIQADNPANLMYSSAAIAVEGYYCNRNLRESSARRTVTMGSCNPPRNVGM